MASTSKGPRIVDLLADIARELWLANRLNALRLGQSVLAHDTNNRSATPEARARVARKNDLRRKVRIELGLEDEETNA